MTSLKYLILFLCTQTALHSQAIFKEKTGTCDTSPSFALESDSIHAAYDNEKLLADICSNFTSKVLRKLRGTISIQVLVDTLGTPCVMSVDNDLNQATAELGLVEIINKKTFWTAPIKNGRKEKVSAIVKLTFEDDFIAIQRFGFNYKTKWREINKYVLKR